MPKAKCGVITNGQAGYIESVVHRRVFVKGSGGLSATIVITVRRGQVWMSIQPPFTWDAIMEPRKAEELIRTLTVAAEGAKRMAHGAQPWLERSQGELEGHT